MKNRNKQKKNKMANLSLIYQCMCHVCVLSHARLFCNPMDCSLPGSSLHGISQARIREWVAISFSKESFWPRDQTWVSCIGRWILYQWATREALYEGSRWYRWMENYQIILSPDDDINDWNQQYLVSCSRCMEELKEKTVWPERDGF